MSGPIPTARRGGKLGGAMTAHLVARRLVGTRQWRRWLLVTVEAVVALNAVGGAVWGLAAAEDVPREWLEGTPFDSYLVPSLILLVAVGGGMGAAAAAHLVNHRLAPEISLVAGATLMGWIAVQVLLIAPNGGVSWLQPAMFAAGGLVATLGWQLRDARAASDVRRTHTHTETALALGLAGIGAGLAVVAVLGPLATGLVDYHVTETLRNQTIGLDAVSLVLVAPLAVLAAVLVRRRHTAGPALALAVGSYTSYMFVQYILGPEYERLPGNNELLFPLALALFVCGWLVVLAAWVTIDVERLPPTPRRDRLVARVALPVLGFLAFVRYLPALADWMSSRPEDAGYLAGPTFAWTIALLDLGVVLPVTVAVCVGLDRREPWARKALYAVVGWFGLVGPAVAAMAITMYLNDDPNGGAGAAAFMTLLGLVFAALAVVVFLPLLRRDSTGGEQRAPMTAAPSAASGHTVGRQSR